MNLFTVFKTESHSRDAFEQDGVTCAIGTAIAERTNIFLNGAEHFSYGWHPYSCAASPIFNPLNGEIIGVVDISTYANKLHLHSLGWMVTVARLIKSELKNRGANFLEKFISEWSKGQLLPQPYLGETYRGKPQEFRTQNSGFRI
jgi:transcriptional regulator of acetoin/glycerol metabolism